MIIRTLKILGVLAFTALAFNVVNTASAFATEGEGWLVEGVSISSGEGALATVTEENLEFANIERKSGVLCSGIFDGTVGPESTDTITKVLNLAGTEIKELDESAATSGISCTGTTTCESGSEIWLLNLPWLTELEGMGSEPFVLDLFLANGAGGDPAYFLLCLALGGLLDATELCEGLTSTKVANGLEERSVAEIFNPASPTESQKMTCNGDADTGTISGEGFISLTSGKPLWALLCLPASPLGQYDTLLDCILEKTAGNYEPGWNDYKLF